MEFRATVVLAGKTATGIQVPNEVVAAMNGGKRPPVVVTLAGYTYRTTVAAYGDEFWIPLAAENREAAGVAAAQEVDVAIELDTAPREVTLPEDLDGAQGRQEDPLYGLDPDGASGCSLASSEKGGTR